MQEIKEIIYSQEGVSLAVKRSALELYRLETEKTHPETKRKRYTTRQALAHVLKWMAGQAAKQKYSNRLSPTERKLVRFLVEGLTQKEMALELGCTERTIREHFMHIRKKVNVGSTYQVVAVAVARGWVSAPKVDDLAE